MVWYQMVFIFAIVALHFALGVRCFADETAHTKQRELTLCGEVVRFDEVNDSYLAKGHATAQIEGQDSRLEADEIRYNDISKLLDAKGQVKITRTGMLTTGDRWKFNVDSKDYLLTEVGAVVGTIRLIDLSQASRTKPPESAEQSQQRLRRFLDGKSNTYDGFDARSLRRMN